MIIGIGTDLVSVERIVKILAKFGSKFIDRVFSESEVRGASKYADQNARARYFAKRFAAKEAYLKAIGLGLGRGIKMQDISVHNDPYGKPYFELLQRTGHAVQLSLSDDGEYALAFVVVARSNSSQV